MTCLKRFVSLFILCGVVLFNAACPVKHYTILSWYPGGVYPATVQYRIYRSQQPTSGFIVEASEPLIITTFTDLGVSSGQVYYYRITAYDTATNRESPPSVIVSAVIP